MTEITHPYTGEILEIDTSAVTFPIKEIDDLVLAIINKFPTVAWGILREAALDCLESKRPKTVDNLVKILNTEYI